MAVYRPDPAFFEAQLRSIDSQDYPRMETLLLDDSADPVHSATVEAMTSRLLTRHPYRLERNDQNLGVQATFGRLTEQSTADLLAYCDQDDIWLPEKIKKLAMLFADSITMGYSNLSIIDGEDKERYPTLQAMNRRFTHKAGAGLFPYFLQDNCVTGTTMMIRREVAQAALPFPESFVQDQWLALWATSLGSIAYTPESLVRYRLHDHNVVGMNSLHGVTDRQSYVSERLQPQMDMLHDAGVRFFEPCQQAEIHRQTQALTRRIAYIQRRRIYLLPSLIQTLWRDPVRLGFEALLGIAPQQMGERLVTFAKNH